MDEEDDDEDATDDLDRKGRRQRFQLKRVDLPKDIQGFKDALMLHVRIIWRLLTRKSIPIDPSPTVLEEFNKRFQSSTTVNVHRHSNILLIAIAKVRGAASTANSQLNSRIVRQARGMEEHIVQYIDSRIASYGLEEWAVDFNQSPYSAYNSAMRIIALDTFKQAVISHAYASLKPNLKYAEDTGMTTRLYDHIVHHYFFRRYTREKVNPGVVNATDNAGPTYQNRIRLAKARRKWLIDNRYPARYVSLIKPAATSDDERDPEGTMVGGRPVFYIKKRPERSEEVTRFLRILDKKRERSAKVDPSCRWKERARREPPGGSEETAFLSIPIEMPVDYFDPTFFNDLPPKLRAKAATYHVSLLPDVEESFTRCPEELYSDARFDAEFGVERMAQYDMIDDVDLMYPAEDEEGAYGEEEGAYEEEHAHEDGDGDVVVD
ncbi:hypothetical protein DFP72DRAFT_810678 [Ephemerocybe angulata]|uniref:Uncharacterized protein n=1 Tax=Ephemerocybe angulata TaxID=980116 RepID=A0A8H6HZX3_9AGAR|nr:hypothetical protein DFP72DRAFT_810678 [Tulosesus angulatus]